jgi:hypothetical protein
MLLGLTIALISLGLSTLGTWDLARLWFWLVVSASLVLIGLQLVVSWTVMRVLEALSLRAGRIEEEFRTSSEPAPVAAERSYTP